MVDSMLIIISIVLGILFLPLLVLAIYWLYIVIDVVGGLLTAWNERWYFNLMRRFEK